MDTIKINKGNVKLIAHRGLSGIERENTNAAFIAAANRSYFGIESDVHITRDKNFAMIHDSTTTRVAEKNINVERSRWKRISKILLNDKEGKKNRSDLKIPSLYEYISICKTYNKFAVLELKGRVSKKNIERIIEAIKDMNYLGNVIFIAFDKRNLIDVKDIYPQASMQYLTSDFNNAIFNFLISEKIDLDISYTKLDKKIVDELHGKGIKVNCWTCDDPAEAEKLVAMGVDYITTNILE